MIISCHVFINTEQNGKYLFSRLLFFSFFIFRLNLWKEAREWTTENTVRWQRIMVCGDGRHRFLFRSPINNKMKLNLIELNWSENCMFYWISSCVRCFCRARSAQFHAHMTLTLATIRNTSIFTVKQPKLTTMMKMLMSQFKVIRYFCLPFGWVEWQIAENKIMQ